MLRIVSPYFVAGIVEQGAVAPIIKYMKGWTFEQIKAYCNKKGWTIEIIKEDNANQSESTSSN
jgi:hypothetical protein